MEQALIGLAGVLIGALVSSWLLTQYQERKEKEIQHSKCIATIYLLLSRCSYLTNFCRNYLTADQSTLTDKVHFSIIYDYIRRDKIDFSSLSFLADKHDSNFLYELALIESTYFNFINSLETRNDILQNVINRLSKVSERSDKSLHSELFTSYELKHFRFNSKSMIHFSCISLQTTKEQMNQLGKIIERRYPNLSHPKPKIEKVTPITI